MKYIIRIKIMAIFMVLLILAACAAMPPSPKKPRESMRIPINKTLPIEVDEVTR